MNVKRFFVDALSSALDLGVATPDDVLRHVTPDLLGVHLPRSLWARLLTACVGAARVDAQLVVETIGVPNLCEHMPSTTIWACLSDIAQRSLGGEIAARAIVTRPQPASKSGPTPLAITSPPPPQPVGASVSAPPAVVGPSIPSPSASAANDAERPSSPLRSRPPTGQRFRQTSTNIGRLANQRRPQAQAAPPVEPPPEPPTRNVSRRGETELEVEIETQVGEREDWRSALAVDEEQLVDWSAADETLTASGDDPAVPKR